MPISDIIRRGSLDIETGRPAQRLTPQDIASLALEADRHRRNAIRAGDLPTAVAAQRERNALCCELAWG